jgi:hypothetical protein
LRKFNSNLFFPIFLLLLSSQATSEQKSVEALPRLPDLVIETELAIDYGSFSTDGVPHELDILPRGASSAKLFTVHRRGVVDVIEGSERKEKPFIDLSSAVGTSFLQGGRLGLISFALHPNFGQPGKPGAGRFYTLHTENTAASPASTDARVFSLSNRQASHFDVLTEWAIDDVSGEALTSTRRELLRIEQPSPTRNSSWISFNTASRYWDHDFGLLYMTVGDGGDAEYAQDRSSPLGSILRIDPLGDDSNPYLVPPDNPFASSFYNLPEIFAYGFRDPVSIYSDPVNNEKVIVLDRGERHVDLYRITRGGNYGWGIESLGGESRAKPEGMIEALLRYPTNNVEGVVGGLVFQDRSNSALRGHVIFSDPGRGILYASTPEPASGKAAAWGRLVLRTNAGESNLEPVAAVSGFGQSFKGDAFFWRSGEGLYQVAPAPGTSEAPGEVDELDDKESDRSAADAIQQGHKGVVQNPWIPLLLLCGGTFFIGLLAWRLVLAQRRKKSARAHSRKPGKFSSEHDLYGHHSKYSATELRIDTEERKVYLAGGGAPTDGVWVPLSEVSDVAILLDGRVPLKEKEQEPVTQYTRRLHEFFTELHKQKLAENESRDLELLIVTRQPTIQFKANFYRRVGHTRISSRPYRGAVSKLLRFFEILRGCEPDMPDLPAPIVNSNRGPATSHPLDKAGTPVSQTDQQQATPASSGATTPRSCSSCGADTAGAKKFCGECGANLTGICAYCDAVNKPGQRYCISCGHALSPAVH